MTNYLEALNLDLDHSSDLGRNRKSVLKSTPWVPTPTTNVSYVAANRLLVVSSIEQAGIIESRLPERIICYIAVPSDQSGDSSEANIHFCSDLSVSGYLGRFTATIDGNDNESGEDTTHNLASIFSIGSGLFDQVLDCGKMPLVSAAIKPPGYYHVGDNQTALDLALESIPELIGEFEKPKYFSYDPGICAHGRSGIPGCTRCIEACPTDAIISIGESIEVNPHLCQGGGSCTASCPTGAITYNYPLANEQHDFVRKALSTIRELDDEAGTTLLIFDNEHGREAIEAAAPGFAGHIFPLVVEEIGSVGLDLVATSLTYGASQVVLFVPAEVPEQVRATLTFNLSVVNAVLDQSGGDTYLATMIRTAEELDSLSVPVRPDDIATFAAIGNKRNTIRTAFNWLAENGNKEQDSIALPEGALFGTVHTQAEGCTLCMGCVAVCPGNALQAGGDTPALRFIEANCVQCGICSRACPESVITLESRLHLDHDTVQRTRTLKEEEPFRCITCNKPFATKAMIARMTEKLKGHWMFDKPDAINRLQMCEDCRVKDMFDKEGSLEQ